MIKDFDSLTTRELYEILKLRSEIFVVEQDCPYQDLDDVDYRAFHLFYMEKSRVIAYLRCFKDENDPAMCHIGRVVTLEHGKGWGGRILKEGIQYCVDVLKAESIYIEAQCQAQGYYEKYGFRAISDVIMVDGIPHRKMLYTRDTSV